MLTSPFLNLESDIETFYRMYRYSWFVPGYISNAQGGRCLTVQPQEALFERYLDGLKVFADIKIYLSAPDINLKPVEMLCQDKIKATLRVFEKDFLSFDVNSSQRYVAALFETHVRVMHLDYLGLVEVTPPRVVRVRTYDVDVDTDICKMFQQLYDQVQIDFDTLVVYSKLSGGLT